jgi:hypothetical protein
MSEDRKFIKVSKLKIGIFGMIGIIAIALKLLELIDLPWLWVLAPLWVIDILALGIAVLFNTYLTIFGKKVPRNDTE